MGYNSLNRFEDSAFMAVAKPMLTEFGIHYILKSCVHHSRLKQLFSKTCQLQKIWSHFSHNFVSLSNGRKFCNLRPQVVIIFSFNKELHDFRKC